MAVCIVVRMLDCICWFEEKYVHKLTFFSQQITMTSEGTEHANYIFERDKKFKEEYVKANKNTRLVPEISKNKNGIEQSFSAKMSSTPVHTPPVEVPVQPVQAVQQTPEAPQITETTSQVVPVLEVDDVHEKQERTNMSNIIIACILSCIVGLIGGILSGKRFFK